MSGLDKCFHLWSCYARLISRYVEGDGFRVLPGIFHLWLHLFHSKSYLLVFFLFPKNKSFTIMVICSFCLVAASSVKVLCEWASLQHPAVKDCVLKTNVHVKEISKLIPGNIITTVTTKRPHNLHILHVLNQLQYVFRFPASSWTVHCVKKSQISQNSLNSL